ncbi:MAG: glycosyltransferase [Microgenomates group bacterium]
MKILPKVTVAVVCFNEEKNIVDCLSSLLQQSYPAFKTEILVIDNNSTDQTIPLIKKFQRKTKRVRLIINPRRGIAISRNVAVKNCRTAFLAFIDADCIAPKNWLKSLVLGYQKYKRKIPNLVAVGGPNYPPKTTSFYQALGIVLNTFLGSRGSVQGRRYEEDREVTHLPCVNVLYEKKAIEEVGWFDESLGSIIEDEDLTYRLLKTGRRFFYLAKSGVIHKMRSNLKDWAKRMVVYGKGRMMFLKKHPEAKKPIFYLPVILVLTAPLSFWFYLFFFGFYSFWLAYRQKKLNLWGKIFLIFFVTHWFYGLGEIKEIFNGKNY